MSKQIDFFYKGCLIDIDKYLTSRKKILTIEQLLGALSETVFYYEILTDSEVYEKATLDALSRHLISDFFGYEVRGTFVYTENRKKYIGINIEFGRIGENYAFDDEGHDKLATPKNMAKYYDYEHLIPSEGYGEVRKTLSNKDRKLITKDGKLKLPKFFKDDIYPVDPSGEAYYLDSLEVTFKLSYVTDDNLLDYIEIV